MKRPWLLADALYARVRNEGGPVAASARCWREQCEGICARSHTRKLSFVTARERALAFRFRARESMCICVGLRVSLCVYA